MDKQGWHLLTKLQPCYRACEETARSYTRILVALVGNNQLHGRQEGH
jgi:hypothetical protein